MSLAQEQSGAVLTPASALKPLFHKILVAVDIAGDAIFEQALQLASALHSELLIVQVLSLGDVENPANDGNFAILGQDAYEQYFQAREQTHLRATQHLEKLVDQAQALGVQAAYVLEEGNPERVIRHLAATWGADLAVVGRRGHTGLSELFLGSVSNYVVHHLTCSVLVVQLQSDG